MKFETLDLVKAQGAILAHKTGDVRKGTVLTENEISRLKAGGVNEVTVARLDDQDVHEDAAATRIASALSSGIGLRATAAHAGRVNLIAVSPGLARINESAVHAMNAIDPMITVATVPPLHRLEPNELVATIKIISYGVSDANVRAAEAVGAGAIDLHLPKPQKIGLIETVFPQTAKISDKGKRVFEARVARLGLETTKMADCPHDTAKLADAIAAMDVDCLAILTASATCDIRDVGPAALTLAGGAVDHFGMPVDPGNLLFIGHIGQTKVIGLPGCARSPALNGADWVLERVLCDVPVNSKDIMAMGVGGLLKEIPTRPKPRRAGDPAL